MFSSISYAVFKSDIAFFIFSSLFVCIYAKMSPEFILSPIFFSSTIPCQMVYFIFFFYSSAHLSLRIFFHISLHLMLLYIHFFLILLIQYILLLVYFLNTLCFHFVFLLTVKISHRLFRFSIFSIAFFLFSSILSPFLASFNI